MTRSEPDNPPDGSRRSSFETTRWSLVLSARGQDTPEAGEALAALCAAYWYPIYAFIRRRGHDRDRAADLTQEFFARVLAKGYLRSVDPSKGRFRAFLMAACKHFLSNEHDRETAQKRGGGCRLISIDRRDAEGRYFAEPSHGLTPERLFERRWALVLLDQTLDRLGLEYHRRGKGALYECLKATLIGADTAVSLARIGGSLEMTEAAVKKASQRLRQRYRQILRESIAETIDDPGCIDEEVRELFAALAS